MQVRPVLNFVCAVTVNALNTHLEDFELFLKVLCVDYAGLQQPSALPLQQESQS